jgi:hypothetical protein
MLVAIAVAAYFLYPIYVATRWSPELNAAAREADRLVIKTGGPCHPHPDQDVVRYESTVTNVIIRVLQGLEAKSTIGVPLPLLWQSYNLFLSWRGGARRGEHAPSRQIALASKRIRRR